MPLQNPHLALDNCQRRVTLGIAARAVVLSSVAAISKVSAIAKGYNDFSIVAVISEIGRNTIPLFRHVIQNKQVASNFKPTRRDCFRLWNERHAVLQGPGACR
jgi:hypothetical protein